VYSTYLGGSGINQSTAIAIDSQGDAYVTGRTSSTNFPLVNPVRSSCGGCSASTPAYDAFVTKFSPSGTSLVYSTYLGGTNDDAAYAIAVDSLGDAVIGGSTTSTDFPLVNPYQTQCTTNCFYGSPSAAGAGFLTKLTSTGQISYSTYFAPNLTQVLGVAINSNGNIFLTGETSCSKLPIVNALYPTPHLSGAGVPVQEAFVAEFNPGGSSLVFSTYLGGSFSQQANGIAFDSSGEVYVAGWTESTDFPTRNALQATMPTVKQQCGGGSGSPNKNVFVTKFGPGGTSLVYSTYLGGDLWAWADALAVDQNNAVYLTGGTAGDFPTTPNTFKPVEPESSCANNSAFVSKIR
jgi:hypothetical protein